MKLPSPSEVISNVRLNSHTMKMPSIKAQCASDLMTNFPRRKKAENTLFFLIKSRDWEKVINYALKFPKEVAKRGEVETLAGNGHTNHILPLHLALVSGAPPHVIKQLLQAYPNAISEAETGTGRLPLHVACLENVSFETLEFIIMEYVGAIRCGDFYGSTPVHHAIFRENSRVIARLLQQDRPAFRIPDREGNTALHLAARHWKDAPLVYNLGREFPQLLNVRNKAGMTPSEEAHEFDHFDTRDALRSLMDEERERNFSLNLPQRRLDKLEESFCSYSSLSGIIHRDS